MQIKLFEVRDKATFLPVIAISTVSANEAQEYLLRHNGCVGSSNLVLLSRLRGNKQSYDPYSWNDRTMHTAHLYIEKHFHNLKDGDVIDVEFILGETSEPKLSERITVYE